MRFSTTSIFLLLVGFASAATPCTRDFAEDYSWNLSATGQDNLEEGYAEIDAMLIYSGIWDLIDQKDGKKGIRDKPADLQCTHRKKYQYPFCFHFQLTREKKAIPTKPVTFGSRAAISWPALLHSTYRRIMISEKLYSNKLRALIPDQ